jgi:hypothetical protein
MTDSCPSCLTRGIPPAATARRGDRLVDGYRCPDCGHQWATARDLTSYPPHPPHLTVRRAPDQPVCDARKAS